jgi:hypothetical protein
MGGGGRVREEGKGYIVKHKCDHDNIYEKVEIIVTDIFLQPMASIFKEQFYSSLAVFHFLQVVHN